MQQMLQHMNKQQPMADATGKSFDPHYLAAKKSIDDRALNQYVWQTLYKSLRQMAGLAEKNGEPLQIVEVGAGIGTMLARIVDRQLLTGPVSYLFIDNDPTQLQEARAYLSHWAKNNGYNLSWSGASCGQLITPETDITLCLEHTGIEELAARTCPPGPFHLLFAHAVLDLVDFTVVLPRLLARLVGNGLAYLTCNFDGETIFLPSCSADEAILKLYHKSMDERLAGASHTGRRLLSFLQGLNLEILAAGSSDWIIHPRNLQYFPDEVFFLHAIIETVHRELAQKNKPLASLTHWARLRHEQVESGELSFLARHLDLLAKVSDSSLA